MTKTLLALLITSFAGCAHVPAIIHAATAPVPAADKTATTDGQAAPAAQPPAKETAEAVSEAPAEEAPAKEAAAKEAPVKEAAAKEAPVKQATAAEAPARETAAAEAPAKEAQAAAPGATTPAVAPGSDAAAATETSVETRGGRVIRRHTRTTCIKDNRRIRCDQLRVRTR